MSAHTPGPWEVFSHSWCETSVIAPGFDHGICTLDINHATEESQEADETQMAANARLIAAAPELLEALEDAVSIFSPEDGEVALAPNWLRRAIAAIAKAEGKP